MTYRVVLEHVDLVVSAGTKEGRTRVVGLPCTRGQ